MKCSFSQTAAAQPYCVLFCEDTVLCWEIYRAFCVVCRAFLQTCNALAHELRQRSLAVCPFVDVQGSFWGIQGSFWGFIGLFLRVYMTFWQTCIALAHELLQRSLVVCSFTIFEHMLHHPYFMHSSHTLFGTSNTHKHTHTQTHTQTHTHAHTHTHTQTHAHRFQTLVTYMSSHQISYTIGLFLGYLGHTGLFYDLRTHIITQSIVQIFVTCTFCKILITSSFT